MRREGMREVKGKNNSDNKKEEMKNRRKHSAEKQNMQKNKSTKERIKVKK